MSLISGKIVGNIKMPKVCKLVTITAILYKSPVSNQSILGQSDVFAVFWRKERIIVVEPWLIYM